MRASRARATTPNPPTSLKPRRFGSRRQPHYGIWFNHRRLLGPIGHVPPAEAEAAFHAQVDAMNEAA